MQLDLWLVSGLVGLFVGWSVSQLPSVDTEALFVLHVITIHVFCTQNYADTRVWDFQYYVFYPVNWHIVGNVPLFWCVNEDYEAYK